MKKFSGGVQEQIWIYREDRINKLEARLTEIMQSKEQQQQQKRKMSRTSKKCATPLPHYHACNKSTTKMGKEAEKYSKK